MKPLNFRLLAAAGAGISLLLFSGLCYGAFQFPKAAGVSLFIILFLIITAIAPEKKSITAGPAVIIFLIYFIWMSARVFLSRWSPAGYYSAAILSCTAFLIPLLSKPDPSLVRGFAAWSSVAACALALIQAASGALRPASFFGNPVFFAEFLLFNLPVIISGLLIQQKDRLLFTAAAALSVMYALLAASKGVLASLFVSLIFVSYFVLKSRAFRPGDMKGKRYYLAFFIVICAAVAVSPGYLRSLSSSVAGLSSPSSSVSGRAVAALTAVEMSKEHPIAGAGAGGYKYFQQFYQAAVLKSSPALSFVNTSYSHDDYLQLLSEAGAVGLGLFLCFAASLALGFEKGSGKLDNPSYIMTAAFMASVMAGLAEALYNFPLFVFPGAFMFWFYAGCAAASLDSGDKVKIMIPARAIAASAALVLCMCLYRFPAQFASDMKLASAVRHDAKFRPGSDRQYLEAIKLDPANRDAYARLAASYCMSGEYASSIAVYEKYLSLYPYSADALYDLGALWLKSGNAEKAAGFFTKAIGFYPGFAQAHLMLARAYDSLNRKKESLEEFNLAIKYDPYVMSRELGESLVMFGEVTEGGKTR